MILDLIFIRHAQSCANIWKNKSKIRQLTYKDPELTDAGVKTSIKFNPILQMKIKELWNTQPYSICSSQMIRAQETAYYMAGNNKPIHISPYIGEDGLSSDNYAFPKNVQRKILQTRNPEIIESLDKGIDLREKQTMSDKSSWSKFIAWANSNPKSFEKGNDGVYRAVIFTHSHFLQNAFKLSKKDKIKNNNGLHSIIIDGAISKFTKLTTGDTLILNGPDKCRLSPFSRKNTKEYSNNLKRNTRRQKACKNFMNNDDLLTNYNQRTYKEHLQDLISYSQL